MPTCEHLFFVQFFVFWDIFWATFYEKPLTEHYARGFSGESDYITHADYQLITIMGRNLECLEAYYIPDCDRRSENV